MSKKTKTAAASRRKKEKRSRKDAQQAKYAAFARAGQNTKSKRSQSKNKIGRTERHAVLFCGNIACKKCSPNVPALVQDLTVRTAVATFHSGKLHFKLQPSNG